jgi:cytochrome c oxidase subunit 2
MHLHRHEKYWLYFGIGSLIFFLAILAFSSFAQGHTPPGSLKTIDPKRVNETPPFDQPGVRQIDEDTYEVNLVAMAFAYNPNKIQVPVGKKIIFNVTSTDVVHSFTIVNTKVNMMVVPGHINTDEYTFKKPGNYLILCNEYCGAAHHQMKMEIEVVEE